MLTLSLELSVGCRGCGGQVAVVACAPRIECDACGRSIEIGDARWTEILADAISEGPRLTTGSERTAPIETPEGVFRRVLRRGSPACRGCGATLDPEALARGATQRWVPCGACGTSLRARTPAWATGGLLAIAGEDPEQLGERTRVAAEPVRFGCPACGGGLDVDGSQRERVVACKYCRARVALPDDVWARLHPRRPVRPIFLLLDIATTASAEQVRLHDVQCAVADRRGMVYLTGYATAQSPETADMESDDGVFWQQAVVCCDERAMVRWIHYPGIQELRVALQHGEEELLVWSKAGERLALRVDGGPGQSKPELPVAGVNALFADADGTWVAVTENDVDRFAATGAELPLFPETPKGFWKSLFKAGDVSIGYLAIATLAPTGDVFTIHRTEHASTKQLTLTRWQRDGSSTAWPFEGGDEYGLHLSGLAVAADGTVWHLPHRGGQLLRMTFANGAPTVAAFPIDPADEDGRMVVLPNGEVLIICEDGVAVRLSCDGRIVWQSDAALRRATEKDIDEAARDDDVY